MAPCICNLIHLECNLCDENDGDELFIVHNDKKIWPAGSKYKKGMTDNKIPVNIRLDGVEPGKPVVLQLWDYNSFLNNKLLGEFLLIVDGPGGTFRSDLRRPEQNGRARYTLEFETKQEAKRMTVKLSKH
jgi:hypothetical protein